MNKKIVAIVLVVALAVTGLFAASTEGTSKKGQFSIGAGIGTDISVVGKYGMGKFDLQGDLSLDFLNGNAFSIDCGAFYNFYDWNVVSGSLKAPQYISFTTGPIAKIMVKNGISLGTIWGAGAEYTFPKVPVTVFLKVGLGAKFDFGENFSVGPTGMGVLGAVYNF